MAVDVRGLLFRVSLVIVALTAQSVLQNPMLPLPSLGTLKDVPHDKISTGPSPLEGPYAPNTLLRQSQRLLEGEVDGSETVVVDEAGDLLVLDKFGYMKQATRDGKGNYYVKGNATYLGAGRPLGGHIAPSGDFLICDSTKGLISLDRSSGQITILANAVSGDSPLAPGSRISYANDLDISADGSVFFSDSSSITPSQNRLGHWDTMRAFVLTGAEGTTTGRLLKYDPLTRKTHCLVEGIWYANGVALSQDESFVVVAETWSLRVLRYWLKGPKAGSLEVFMDRLPGYPDGISRTDDGHFWVAVAAPTLGLVQNALPHRWLRWAMAWLSEFIAPKPNKYGMVIKVDKNGTPVFSLQDPGGKVIPMVTSVTQSGGKLYLGNLAYPFIGSFDMANLPESIMGASAEGQAT